jgi:hypothetical protein
MTTRRACLLIVTASLFLCSLTTATHSQESGAQDKPLFRDFMGINGHTVLFKPELYSQVSRLVRDYHPMEWDTGPDSDYKLDFPMARNRVSWEQVYGSWKKAGFTTDACVMFETLEPNAWKDLARDSHRYGQAFAAQFGPAGKTPLIESVEIGNEPGKYGDDAYRTVFKEMARGIREADPKIKIATCNVNVGKSGDYHKSVECVAGLEDLYDVLNIHTYAMLEPWPTWKRSFPEDTRLKNFVGDIDQLIDWRNKKAKGKAIWITEFGWDSSTKLPATEGDFSKWIGNSDLEQAQWLVRSFFLFATIDVQRAYIYFFNDDDEPKLHGASGLTRKFEPKPAFYAVAHLYRTLGDYRFSRVVHHENAKASVYEFIHGSDPSKVIWAAWSPTGSNQTTTITLDLERMQPSHSEAMPVGPAAVLQTKLTDRDELTVEVSESPLYLFLTRH